MGDAGNRVVTLCQGAKSPHKAFLFSLRQGLSMQLSLAWNLYAVLELGCEPSNSHNLLRNSVSII